MCSCNLLVERLRDLTTQGWETAQQLLAMAVADLQTARGEKNREKVEAAKKEVQAAREEGRTRVQPRPGQLALEVTGALRLVVFGA